MNTITPEFPGYPHYPMLSKGVGLVLSHSTNSAFEHCPRKGLEFKQCFGRTPIVDDDNYAGAVGNAMHRALGVWLQEQDENKAIVEFLVHFPHKLEMLKVNNQQRSLEAAFATLLFLFNSPFLQRYHVAQLRLDDGQVVDAIEVPFAIQITGSPIKVPVYYVGLIDLIMYDPVEDKYVIVDLKTTRQNFKDYEHRFTFDEQTIPYGIILEHTLGRSIDDFKVIYLSAFTDLMEPKITEYPVEKTQDYIEDWLFGICDKIERIAKYLDLAKFPRATDGQSCVGFQRKCHFLEYCYYRNVNSLEKIFEGTARTTFFSNSNLVPMITAELPYGSHV